MGKKEDNYNQPEKKSDDMLEPEKGIENESKEDKFIRLCNSRVNKLLKSIELVGNLGNKALYGYSIEQIDKMLSVIQNKFNDIKLKFTFDSPKEKTQFKL